LIIDEKKLIIVDYKTDNIDQNQFEARVDKYLPQLRFYAYIVSRLFHKSCEVEGKIIFIKHPNQAFTFNYDDTTDEQVKLNLKLMISSIRNNDYSLNLDACDDCFFTFDKSQCININST
jgi:hypothetical protein